MERFDSFQLGSISQKIGRGVSNATEVGTGGHEGGKTHHISLFICVRFLNSGEKSVFWK